MKKRYLITIAVTVMVMFLFFWRDHSELPPESIEVDSSHKTARLDTEKKSEEMIKKQLMESESLKAKASAAAATPDQIDEVQKSFATQVHQLGQCIGVATTMNSEKADPTFDNLIISLQSSLGDTVVKMQDWSQLDVKSANGSVKRIRTEVEYPENNTPVTHAQLYNINEQGMPELQQLNPDQAFNPTEGYLESLKGDAVTVNDEKGARVYYGEGEELVLVERNGKLQSFSLTKGEKTFSCTETDTTTSNCQCL